jgi:hypothetical protein
MRLNSARSLVTAALCVGLAVACAPPTPSDSTTAPIPGAAPDVPLEPVGTGFELRVAFSPAAAAKLRETGEKLEVSAIYYGDPKPGVKLEDEKDMGVALGEERLVIDGVDQTMTFKAAYDTAKAASDLASPARVLINAYTARTVLSDNILDCGLFDDAISVARAQGISLTCKLIEEPPAAAPN